MELTLSLAAANTAEGDWPFAAVIVKDGAPLAEGVNGVHRSHDPSDHAEIAAIRKASASIASPDLSGAVMSVVGMPRPMCLGCLLWARIGTVVYAIDVPAKDAALSTLPPNRALYDLVATDFASAAIERRHLDRFSERGVEVFRRFDRSRAAG